jgi:hypothetical protein
MIKTGKFFLIQKAYQLRNSTGKAELCSDGSFAGTNKERKIEFQGTENLGFIKLLAVCYHSEVFQTNQLHQTI